MTQRSGVWREGVVAGLWGAAGVAAWFFVLDLLKGAPLATPEMLGRALWSVLGKGIALSAPANVAGYTVVHLAVFIGLGLALSVLVEASRRVPGVLAGAALLFVLFEFGFYLAALLLAQSPEWTGIAWYHIAAANLVAAGLMGRVIWRAHPDIGARISQALDGRV
jgi:hypothetical protein